jgi:hypothetical protein
MAALRTEVRREVRVQAKRIGPHRSKTTRLTLVAINGLKKIEGIAAKSKAHASSASIHNSKYISHNFYLKCSTRTANIGTSNEGPDPVALARGLIDLSSSRLVNYYKHLIGTLQTINSQVPISNLNIIWWNHSMIPGLESASRRRVLLRRDTKRRQGMRILLAVLAITVVAVAAHAQDMGGRGGKGRGSQQSGEQQKADQQKKKAVDDAYKSALGRIPDSKEKYDPWQGVR